MKYLFCWVCIVWQASLAYAQDSFLSRIYFPTTYGRNMPLGNKALSAGSAVVSGVEYRFNIDKGTFLRMNFDNQVNQYQLSTSFTNVEKSRLSTTGYFLGIGYRVGKAKWKVYGLLQSGWSEMEYPIVTLIGNNRFEVQYASHTAWTQKMSVGVEYFFTRNFGLVLDLAYKDAWNKNILTPYNNLKVTIGFTTTLF